MCFNGEIFHVTPSWVSYEEQIKILNKLNDLGELMKHPWMERRHNVGKGDNSAIALKGVATVRVREGGRGWGSG